MTDPLHAVATESGRFYNIPGYEDVTFRSSTNICGIMDKPAIAGAAAKRAGERAVYQELEWHAIQQEEYARLAANPRIKDKSPKTLQKRADEAARLWISRAAQDYNDYAAQQGSAVHFAAEHFDDHITVIDGQAIFDEWLIDQLVTKWATDMAKYRYSVDKNVEQIRKHINQLIKCFEEYGIEAVDRERTVCNPELGYAGTLDLTGRITRHPDFDPKMLVVIDYKTGFLARESLPLQLCSYRRATHEVHRNKTVKRTAIVGGAAVIHLKPESYHLYPVRTDDEVFAYFQDAMRLWTWKHEDSKGVFGEEKR